MQVNIKKSASAMQERGAARTEAYYLASILVRITLERLKRRCTWHVLDPKKRTDQISVEWLRFSATF
jgi:hypothetical protein